MRRCSSWLVVSLLFLLSLPATAPAGPNTGATLILHQSGYAERYHDPPYCGQSNLTNCEDAVTTSPGGSYEQKPIWFVLAAFPDGSSPRMKAVSFGIHYDPGNLHVSDHGACIGDPNNGAIEFPTSGWPASGTGTSVVFQNVQTGHLVEVYWFDGYDLDAVPTLFSVTPNPDPSLGGMIADDSVPSNLDPIACYSSLGFDTPGDLCCPSQVGACCLGDSCTLAGPSLCTQLRGTFGGAGSDCDPYPCGANSGLSAGGGASTAARLLGALPNPTAEGTAIRFYLPGPSEVDLRVYDAVGRCVRHLGPQPMAGGVRSFVWDGTDDQGHPVLGGVYPFRLNAAGGAFGGKVIILR